MAEPVTALTGCLAPIDKGGLESLIAKGKEQGYLTYAEVNDHLPQDISDPDQVEDIIHNLFPNYKPSLNFA